MWKWGLLSQLSQANINKQGSVVKRFFFMEPSESKSNTKEVVEGKPVKEIAERAVSLETKASVKSAVITWVPRLVRDCGLPNRDSLLPLPPRLVQRLGSAFDHIVCNSES